MEWAILILLIAVAIVGLIYILSWLADTKRSQALPSQNDPVWFLWGFFGHSNSNPPSDAGHQHHHCGGHDCGHHHGGFDGGHSGFDGGGHH